MQYRMWCVQRSVLTGVRDIPLLNKGVDGYDV